METPLETPEGEGLEPSSQDRAALIERLIDSIVPPPPLHPAWGTEIARRIDDIDSGHVEMIPSEQVFAQARAHIEARGRKP